MKELIEYVACSLVDDPGAVKIEQTRKGGEMIFELHVAKEDMGRIIGRSGRVANALRVLLRVAAAREGKQATLEVVEPR